MTFIIIFIFLIILSFQISEHKMIVKKAKSDMIMDTTIMDTRFSRLNRMTIVSLKNLCKEKGYKKYTQLKKKDLIEFIMNQPEDVKYSLHTSQYSKSSRSSVEFNGMELVCALLILNPKIRTFKQLFQCESSTDLTSKIIFNKSCDFQDYIDDIKKKEKMVVEYMQNFRPYIRLWISKPIEKIFLSGKHNTHEEIETLNKGSCKLEAKSDLYIKFTNGSFYGLSVKQSKDCTKSNYSVQKILRDLDEDVDKELTTIKKEYLKQNGFDKFRKSRRKDVNELFYSVNKNNPYMNKLREELNKNCDYIGKYLVNKLYSTSIGYDIYEFNGEELIKLKSVKDMDVSFYEHKPYYYDKKDNERKTAKLFYRLVTVDKSCNEDKTYRIEVRWKGNVHDSSPQFQIHEE